MKPGRTPQLRRVERFDAIVVGARVAGASTAMLLARQGLRVVALERSREGSDALSTHALLRPGVVQLGRWGLLDEVAASGAPPVRRTVIHYGDEVAAIDIAARHGVDAFYAPRRTVLDAILARAARAAGAELRFGVPVTGLVRDDDGRVRGVEVRGAGGRRTEMHAPITIGADGRRSLVATAVGAPDDWRGAGAGGVVYAYFAGLEVDGYEWLYRPHVSAALIPTNGGEVNVSATVPAARFAHDVRPDVERGFWRILAEADREVAQRVAAATRTSRWHSFAGQPGYHRRPFGPGWALVGDAGSFMDPTGAHGISSALRDAELLARAIVRAHGGAVGEGEALAAYRRSRDDLSARFFQAVDAVASYRWDLASLRAELMAMSVEMGRESEALTLLDRPPALRPAA